MHVEQVDNVRQLSAVEYGLFDDKCPQAEGKRVDYCRPDASTGGAADHHDSVDAESSEIANERSAEEGTWPKLWNHDVAVYWSDGRRDLMQRWIKLIASERDSRSGCATVRVAVGPHGVEDR
jgi:hypothetical protein